MLLVLRRGIQTLHGNCIVASAKKNDMELICVILGAGSDVTTTTNKFDDCISLFDYGFKEYQYETLCHANDVFKVISPKYASKDTLELPVLYENDIRAFVKKEDLETGFSPNVELDENIKAPIRKGSVVGKISYTIDDTNYTTNLIASQDISSNSLLPIAFKIVLVIAALLVLKCLVNLLGGGKKKGKRKKGKHSKSQKSKKKKRNSRSNANFSLYHFDY